MQSKILFLSHSFRGPHVRVGSHHLTEALARRGEQVLHVSTPLSILAAGKTKNRQRLKQALKGSIKHSEMLRDVVPLVIAPQGMASNLLNLRRVLQRSDFASPDFVFVDQPAFAPLIGDFPNARKIYRPTDEHPSGRLHMLEADLVKKVDGVAATSQRVLQVLHLDSDLPQTVIENGVDTKHFSTSADLGLARRGAIYVGAVDFRFDWAAVTEIAEALAPEPVTITGPVTASVPLLPANVVLTGPIPYTDAPAVMKTHRIGLLPFNEDPANEGRSPMKYYEYLASGLYVLARRTSELARRREESSWLYESLEELVEVAGKIPLSFNSSGATLAKQFDWEARAEELFTFASATK